MLRRRYRHVPHNHDVPQPIHVGRGASRFDIPDWENGSYTGLWRVTFEGECRVCSELVRVTVLLSSPIKHPGYGPMGNVLTQD